MSPCAAHVRVRPMRAADVERVLEIAGSLPQAPHWLASAYLKAIAAESTPRRIALVAEAPGLPLQVSGSEGGHAHALLGFLVASLIPPEAELETIAVSGEEQRRGVAGSLLSGLLRQLEAEKVLRVHLEVRGSNVEAQGFYLRHGFREAGRRARYYADPEEDAVLMVWALERCRVEIDGGGTAGSI